MLGCRDDGRAMTYSTNHAILFGPGYADGGALAAHSVVAVVLQSHASVWLQYVFDSLTIHKCDRGLPCTFFCIHCRIGPEFAPELQSAAARSSST